MLGQQLIQDGIAYLDLTPGYEAFKEQLATSHDEVIELVIAGNLSFQGKRLIRKQVSNWLIKAKIRPLTLEVALKKRLYLLRQRSLVASLKDQLKRFGKKPKQRLYQVKSSLINIGSSLIIQKNNLENLLNFEQERGGNLTRWEFLANSLNRFEAEEHCYSWAEGGRLLGCIWLRGPKPSTDGKDPNIAVTEDAILLKDLYLHSAGQHLLKSFMLAAAAEATATSSEDQVFVVVENPAHCHALESAGFRQTETII